MSLLLPARGGADDRAAARVVRLGDDDLPAVRDLVERDPVTHAALHARLVAGTLDPRVLGGVLWGVRDGSGRLRAAALSGGNLVPVGDDPDAWQPLAAQLGTRRRVCSAITGPAPAVTALWTSLQPAWGPARLERLEQPLLATTRSAPAPARAARVELVQLDALEAYLPAAAAMFAEELALPPGHATDSPPYRARVERLIRDQRALAVFDDTGAVIFKADIGVVAPGACQVHGVWTRPDLRGRGLATAAMPAVLDHALFLAPVASLYVNDFNLAARRLYARMGMRQVGTLATVLF